MSDIRKVHRRGFLRDMFSAGAVVLGSSYLPAATNTTGYDSYAKSSWKPNVFLGLNPDGTVVIVAHRSEMGTGARSALPMLLADELDADWKHVRVEQAIGNAKYGSQNTDGSCSVRDFYNTIREAGATARLMLERAAAEKWKVPAAECKAQLHQVVHAKSGKKAGFGELAKLAAAQPVPKKEELRFKTAAEYRYVGKENFPTVDRDDLCAGRGTFGIDAKVPGMVYASIERSPVFGGKLKNFDDADAKKVKGVIRTATIDAFKPPHVFQALGGVAVLADNTWAAIQGRKKLKVNWDSGEHASYDSDAYKNELRQTARQPGKVVRDIGNVDTAFAGAAKTHEAEYYVPLLSHVPMEPPAAIAEFKDGKVTAWANTQNPQAVQDAVSAALGIKKEDVTCHVTLLGGGFGRKSKPDYVCEAALLSKQVGKPVKVVWTREEDVKFDFYHACSAMYMKAALDAQGKPTAWLHRSVFPSIGTTFDHNARHAMDLEMGMGWVDLPYNIPNHRAENGAAQNHVRIGWMRAVANIYHAFGIHSFVDELAALAGRDRVEYLLDLLPAGKVEIKPKGIPYWNHDQSQDRYPLDNTRLRRVIQLAAEKAGWGKKKNLGIAAHRSFLTYVAVVAEIDVDSQGRVRIPNMHIAADAGTTIYPDRVRSQFEGAGVFGTSIAMLGEITAKNGRIVQSNFSDYPVARMADAPRQVHVHMVPSTELPAGVGEPGVPPVAPALTNAIFAVTGKRVRDLPVRKTKLV